MPDINAFMRGLNSPAKNEESPLDENNQLKERHEINGVPDVVLRMRQNNLNYTPEEQNEILKLTGDFNPSRYYDIHSEEYQQKRAAQEQVKKAMEQGWLEQLWNGTRQLVENEVVLSIFEGFANLADAAINTISNNTEDKDYSNNISRFFEELQDKNRERLAIYRMNPYKAFDVGDFGWWTENAVSIGSTASLLVPGLVAGAGAGKIMKAMKLAKLTNGINKTKIARALAKEGNLIRRPNLLARNIEEFGKSAGAAFTSRIGENYQEAREAYRESYNDTVEKLKKYTDDEWKEFRKNNPEYADPNLTPEQIANDIVGNAADDVFKRDMALFWLDLLQYKSIEKGLNAARFTGFGIRKEQAHVISELAGKTTKHIDNKLFSLNNIKALPGTALETIKEFGKFAAKHPGKVLAYSELSEAFEEGYQGINSSRAKDIVDSYFNPNISTKAILEYAQDPHVLEQALWGMLGGLAFGPMAHVVKKVGGYGIATFNKLTKKDKFNEADYQRLLDGDSHIAKEEIRGRKEIIDNYISKYKDIEANRNPYVTNEDGTAKEFTNDVEKQKAKRDLNKEFIQELVFNATDAGNIDLLIDFINNPVFDEYLKKNGVNLDLNNAKELRNIVKDTADRYIDSINAVYANADVDNDHIALMMARSIARAKDKIESLDSQIQDIYDDLNMLDESSDWTENHTNLLRAEFIKRRIEQHRANIASFERNNDYSKQAKEAAIKREEESIHVLKNLLKDTVNDVMVQQQIDVDSEGALDRIVATLNKKLNDSNAKPLDDIDERVRSLEGRMVAYEIAKANWQAAIPEQNVKNSYNELYEDFAASTYELLNTRLGRALNNVQQWITKQENIDEAINKIYNDEVPDLKEDLDMLKLGAKNRQNVTALFNMMTRKIKQDKQKVENSTKEVTDNGVELDEKTSKEVNEELDKNNPIEEASSPVEETNPTETPESSEETPKTFEEEAVESMAAVPEEELNIPQEEVVGLTALDMLASEQPQLSDEEAELLRDESESLYEQMIENDSNILSLGVAAGIESIVHNIDRLALIRSKGREYINTDDYKKLQEEVKEYLINEGISEKVINENLNTVLDCAFAQVVDSLKRNEDSDASSMKEVLDAMRTISVPVKFDEQSSKLYTKTQEEIDKEMNNFFSTYFKNADVFKGETSDGKVVIDLDSLFEFIKEQADLHNWSYTTVAMAIRNIINYVYTNKSSIYQFEGKGYIDNLNENGKVSYNLDKVYDLINQIYEKEFVTEVTEESFHVQISNTHFGKIVGEDGFYKTNSVGEPIYYEGYNPKNAASKGNILKSIETEPLFTRVIKIKNKDGRIEDYSLAVGFKDTKGNFVEVGYLALVEANETNTILKKLDTTEGLNLIVEKVDDNTFVFKNKALNDLIESLIDSFGTDYNGNLTSIANTLLKYFQQKNYKLYTSKSVSGEVKELLGRRVSINEKIKFLQNDKVRSFINESNFKYNGKKLNGTNIDELIETDPGFINKVFEEVASSIADILFYPYKNSMYYKGKINISKGVLQNSYATYAQKVWQNYEQTNNLRLDNGSTELTYKSDNASRFNYDKGQTTDIKDIGLKKRVKNYKFIYFDGNVGRIEGDNNTIAKPYCFQSGACGILIDTKNGLPFVATFQGSNFLNKESELYKGLEEHIKDLFNALYNSTGSASAKAYDNLRNLFRDLCVGKNALFKGVIIRDGYAGFSIGTYSPENGFTKIIEFYKYNLRRDEATKSWRTIDNNVVTEEELESYRGKNARYIDKEGNTHLIVNKNKKQDEAAINMFVTDLLSRLWFNKTGIATRKDTTSNLVSFGTDGSMTINLGTKKDGSARQITYDNFVDYAIKNNAYTTTYKGRGVRSEFVNADGRTKKALYLGFKTKETSKDAPNTRATNGLLINLKQANVEEGGTVNTEDILLYGGVAEEEINMLSSNGLIGDVNKNGFLPTNVKISYKPNPAEGHEEDHASYNPKTDTITIWGPGIDFVSNPNVDSNFHIKRLLIHENVHKVFRNSGFFKEGKTSEIRVDRILDIYNRFKEKVLEENNESWVKFINDFEKGNKVASAKTFEERANVANEFVAEALSNKYLMEGLNSIEYKTENTIKDSDTKNKTLLQKLLDLIIKFFDKISDNGFKIDENTALSALYDSLGTPTELNTFEKDNTSSAESTEVSSEQALEEETELTKALRDAGDIESEDDDIDELDEVNYDQYADTDYSSKLVGVDEHLTSSEHKLDSIDKHRDFNPYRVRMVSNMEDYIHEFPLSEQAAMRSEMNAGAVEFVCR